MIPNIYLKLLFVIIYILLFSYIYLPAEYASGISFSGFVKDSVSEEPLIGATVFLEGTGKGAVTNKNGFFSIQDIAQGNHTVSVTYIGYLPVKQRITFNESLRKSFLLPPSTVTTEEITVQARRQEEKRVIKVSKVNIPVKQLKNIRIGGETDIFRSLQYLPGVLTSSQISSGLYVRGGSPDQNLVLLDGTAVYNPTHLFGFISTFNTSALKDVELIKGGFPAEYGGRMSAVLDITQKEGNRNEYHGSANIGVISSKVSAEGPLGSGAFFIGARRTYLELVKAFIPEDPEEPIPDFNFYDVNLKITQDISEDDKIFLSGFISSDYLLYDSFGATVDLNVGNKLAALRWNHIFANDLFLVTNLSASNYKNELAGDQSGYEFIISNGITDITFKGSLEWFASEKITAKFGYNVTNYQFDYLQNFTGNIDTLITDTTAGTVDIHVHDWKYDAFAQINYRPTELLSLQAGWRGSYWDLRSGFFHDPRLAVQYRLQSNLAVKAAWGIFHQNLKLAYQPDFSFFDTWLPTDSTVLASWGEHYIVSVESTPFDDWMVNLDFYYKTMNNINELNRTSLDGDNAEDIFFTGNGSAYGAEIFIQKRVGRLTGWMGYALGFITARFDSINQGKEFRPKYDRRHDFKIVAQYQLSKDWDIGASFSFQSGQSYTGATSRFQIRMPDQNYGRGKIIQSQYYGLRLPPSHQLNLNASYSFKTFGQDSKVILDIYNVYNRRDIWFRYYNTRSLDTYAEDVKLLPILPTLSYEINF